MSALRELLAVAMMLVGFGVFAYGGFVLDTTVGWVGGLLAGLVLFGLGAREIILLAMRAPGR